MKKVTVQIEGVSPLCQGRFHNTEKLDKENANDYEKRTWRSRLHIQDDGQVFIPAFALKNCLAECAKFLSIQIPGKGKATYTKHFEAGVLVLDAAPLGIMADAVVKEERFVPSDGRRGGGNRVIKYFPVMPEWKCEAEFFIVDETVTSEVFQDHLRQAGQFIGLGSFRVRNNGIYGRFKVNDYKWSEVS